MMLIYKEIQILFPELKDISIGKHLINQHTDSVRAMTYLIYTVDDKNEKVDREKIEKWLNQKFNTKNVTLIKQE